MFALGAYGGLWHWEQGAVACAPASAKYALWVKALFCDQVASVFLWQLSHVVAKPVWGTGVVAPVKSLTWHP